MPFSFGFLSSLFCFIHGFHIQFTSYPSVGHIYPSGTEPTNLFLSLHSLGIFVPAGLDLKPRPSIYEV